MIHGRKGRLAKLLGSGVIVVSLLLLSACSGASDDGPADEAFLEDLVGGWTARWDYFAKPENKLDVDDADYAEQHKEQLTEGVNLELDKVEPYGKRDFEDKELKKRAVDYIDILNESLEAIEYLNVDDVKHIELWTENYDRRTVAILDFIDTYELETPEGHEKVVKEMRTNADLATSKAKMEESLTEVFCGLSWQQSPPQFEGDTFFAYTATANNPLDTDFASVSLEVSLIDASGVNTGTTYASINNWRAGQSAVFELSFLDAPLVSFDISANWQTADGAYGDLAALCE